MIRIRNESDFRNWFKKDYKKLGFSEILKSNTKGCPDFVMLKNGKETKVELEIKSSNFLYHNHPIDCVDKVVCVIEDIRLDIPTIKVENVKLIKFNQKAPYSFKELIMPLFKKEKVLTTPEVASILKISYGAAERALMELVVEGKVIEKRKKGVNLWMKK